MAVCAVRATGRSAARWSTSRATKRWPLCSHSLVTIARASHEVAVVHEAVVLHHGLDVDPRAEPHVRRQHVVGVAQQPAGVGDARVDVERQRLAHVVEVLVGLVGVEPVRSEAERRCRARAPRGAAGGGSTRCSTSGQSPRSGTGAALDAGSDASPVAHTVAGRVADLEAAVAGRHDVDRRRRRTPASGSGPASCLAPASRAPTPRPAGGSGRRTRRRRARAHPGTRSGGRPRRRGSCSSTRSRCCGR